VGAFPAHSATAPHAPAATLTPAQAAQEVRIVKRALTALHPGLTKYQTDAEWQAALARFEAQATGATTPTAMYLTVTALAVSIRCGHTWTNSFNQSGAIKAALFDAPNKLPFTMTLVEGRWMVLASATPDIRAGDEVLSVDGHEARQMVALMWPYLRADGASDEKRLRQLSHDRLDHSQMDLTWPLVRPPVEGRYRVQLKRDNKVLGEVTAIATTLAARKAALSAQGAAPRSSAWSLEVRDNHAVMRLPTFAFYDGKFDWKRWLAESFATLNEKRVTHLIIDIRDLEGGDGAIGEALLSYLLAAPYRYTSNQAVTSYERVPYVLARYLDTWDFDFFDRTGKVEPITSGPQQGKYRVKARAKGERMITPVPVPFAGRVTLLVSGENSSAGYLFARLAQDAKAATLIGQRTGGNLRGLNGGELTWLTLPHSGVALDIPLLAHEYASNTPDASVIPDVLVQKTFAAQRAGVDEEMAAALAQARTSIAAPR
jgi:C-terminal processing protease CtpA/Prc